MDNLDKKKIHVNPDFLAKRGEIQSQSRVHVNPAFFARASQEIQQSASVCTTVTSFNNLQNVNAQAHMFTRPVSVQPQSSKDFASSHPVLKNEQYSSNPVSNKSLFMSVPNSVYNQKVNFGTSESQRVPPRTIIAPSGPSAFAWNNQSDIKSRKPFSYSWKASEPSQPNKLLSAASNSSRKIKLLDSNMSFRSSRFKYHYQNGSFNNTALVTGSHVLNYSGNKFKIDNRKNDQVNPAQKIQSMATKKNEPSKVSNISKVSDSKAREQSDPVLSVCTKSTEGAYVNSGDVEHIKDLHDSKSCVIRLAPKSLENKSVIKNSEDNLEKIRVDAQNSVPKYKVISRTKLVRQRSRSFSKDKTKENLSKGRLLENGLLGQPHPCSVTVCRPSPKFPTRSPYHWGKTQPKRRYAVLSRTKLIRRLSCSSSTGDDLKDIPRYSVKTKTKLVKKLPDSGQNGADSHKKYVVLSNTKLIRKKPSSSVNGTKGQNERNKQNNDVIERHKLIRNANVKTGINQGCERVDIKTLRRMSSLYKIVNKSTSLSVKQKAARGIVSKYKINRLKSEVPLVKKLDIARGVASKYRTCRPRDGSSVFKKHKIIGGASRYRLNRLAVEMCTVKSQKTARGIVSKYRINRLKSADGFVSKYTINRLKPASAAVLQTGSGRFKWISSKGIPQHSYPGQKRGSGKFSDRIINIGGILYKATQTSLKKQLAKKRQMLKESDGSKCIVKLHGYQYYLSASGKTLTRIKDESSSVSAPPLSRVHIGGLTYSRTKAGQYELTKAHQARAVLSSAKQRSVALLAQRRKRGILQKRNQYCIFFNRFGRCTKKDKGECPYLHDPKRVAICTRFLRGRCPVDNCPFSHEIDPNKMPVCSHFVRSICTRDNCPYRHVKVSASAPVCLDFLHGHCPLGEECKKQHLLECEEFSITGKCPRGESCPLSHRKGARKKKKSVSLEPASITDGKIMSCQQPRRRKSSELEEILGGQSVKKLEKKSKLKKNGAIRKRYFQVNEMEVAGKECVVAEKNTDTVLVSTVKQSFSDGKCVISEKITSFDSLISLSNEEDVSTNENPGEKCFANNTSESILNLAKVRERVLQKVEKLKKAYTSQEGQDSSGIQSTDQNQNSPISAGDRKITDEVETSNNCETKSQDCMNGTTNKSEHTIYTYERRPLPKILPSYIPLSNDNKEVEEL